MRMILFVLTLGACVIATGAVEAAQLAVEIAPATGNPASPRMGDRLTFRATIRNTGRDTARGVVGWLSLLQVDPGKEQSVDLEDWSAQKAVTLSSLAPGHSVATEWVLRLIQTGEYRVAVVAGAAGSGSAPVPSSFADFAVLPKPVVESSRILPIAVGLPLLLGGALGWRVRSARKRPA
jgi:hypothetical protein